MKIKKILVSQPQPATEKSPYFDIEKKYGVKFVFRPFIKVEGISAKEFRQQKIAIQDYSAVVFTARTAIDHFFRLCEELRVSVSEDLKYFCIGEQIALYLQKYIQYRKRKIFYPESGRVEDLVELIQKHSNDNNFLVSVSYVHKDDLISKLDENNINYTKAVMYRTVSNDFEEGEAFDYDMLIFFSPSGIVAMLKNFPNFVQGDIHIACLGPTTARAIREAGLRLDLEAPTPNAPSITAALDQYLKDNGK
ncbi:MAG: uroporphyrinogen-III synthase [Bacteroidales bacterium]|nr:uroporphyrinogen-III synthase [Bacteroidales bacterium]MDI9545275.1 uroporphyrinogen-III synthase [Bacteroidota bacterium]OQC03600.1 MAG: uroporphyrinogen-III synthase [Bacteroidetes bacterium ADurb.Bin090]HNZ80854.1 uroporphyrinogen-III synthase [Bacteroidales bacterium]HOD26273.1 uroporphyrinogen-III synthase [Bacteroidales bacterium]